ncbi:hypothetical protein TAMA11512_04320 [Selenomonas sp. TAMA-11512]|uniref:glycosyltransferase family protein n=1 Tax=Selenomonas sp. TAMA-11512 TaxID=3095337 RepID=UPI003087162D|nr:hypothetical protein TAMA11512_04320 [Selenomonas sp. TAMA-11512]
MRVLYITTTQNASLFAMDKTLMNMGHEAHFFPMDSFYANASYVEKKLQKLGCKAGQKRYYEAQKRRLLERVKELQPESVLFFNPNYDHAELFAAIEQTAKLRIFLIDPIGEDIRHLPHLPKQGVYTYDRGDVGRLAAYGIEAQYLPIGATDAYAYATVPKDIDISFVGTPYGVRWEFLDRIAATGERNGWKLAFYGPFYEEQNAIRSWLQKRRFASKHGALAKVAVNGRQSPAEVALVYARSKICLNIDGNARAHFNPRTYDILATGSFQLMDRHPDFQEDIIEGRDYAAFDGAEDCLEKCAYYLSHGEERERIAGQGHESAKHITMEHTLRELLK